MSNCNGYSHFDLLTLKRPTKLDKLILSIEKPKGAVPRNSLPRWNEMPLDAKLPLYNIPKGTVILSCRKIGEKLWKVPEGNDFTVQDPYGRQFAYEYNALHDEHLKPFFCRKRIRDQLLKFGFISERGEVVCTLKQLNEYRRHLKMVHASKIHTQLKVKDEVEKEMQQLSLARKFHMRDNEKTLTRVIHKDDMRPKVEKDTRERRALERKRSEEHTVRLARRRAEENRQRLVKHCLRNEKLQKHLQVAREMEQRRKMSLIRRHKELDARIRCRKRREELENIKKKEAQICDFWERKRKEQLTTIQRNSKILEALKQEQEQKVAMINRVVQDEALRMELLYNIKEKEKEGMHQHMKLAEQKQKALREALSRAWGSRNASTDEQDNSRLISQSVEMALSVMINRPGVQDMYHILERAKQKLERITSVPEPVNCVIDTLLENVIVKYVRKHVTEMVEKVYDRAEENIRFRRLQRLADSMRQTSLSGRSVTSKTGSCILSKGSGSSTKMTHGVSFGSVETIDEIKTKSDLQSIKDRPPTPVPSLTDLAEAVFSDPSPVLECDVSELSRGKHDVDVFFTDLSKQLLKVVIRRTEKSFEQKQKLFYQPATVLSKAEVIQRLTKAITSLNIENVSDCEEGHLAVDYIMRRLLETFQPRKMSPTGSLV